MCDYKVGDWVVARSHPARVRYVGGTDFAEGTWIGLELQREVGKNDGSVRGVRYFTCPPRCGLLVRPAHLRAISEVEAKSMAEKEAAAAAAAAPDTGAASAWSAMENMLESEALQAGRQGERVMAHLQQLHPKPPGSDAGAAPVRGRARAGAVSRPNKRPSAKLKSMLQLEGDSAFQSYLDELPMPGDYTGPRFSGRPTMKDAEALLAHVKAYVGAGHQGAAIPQRVAMQLLLSIKNELLQRDTNVQEVKLDDGRLVIVGDTHGQLADFCWLLRSHGLPAAGNVYCINGDVADRGRNATEILLLIFAFMLAAPGRIVMNRGNHESHDMNVRGFQEGGGFAAEVGSKYDSTTFTLFQEVFNQLALATLVNNEVLIVHGGLCRNPSTTLEDIRKINRKRPVPVSPNNPDDVLFFDLMWADPRAGAGIGLSAVRGAGCCTFGPDVTRRFCEVNRLRMVIRSHEVPKTLTGVQVQHDGRLVTVFSASNYCGRIGNTGGTMLLTPELNYQLMEHWAPSLQELLRIEEEERAEAEAAAEPSERSSVAAAIGEPASKRKEFEIQAEALMRADVLDKMKELICANKQALTRYYEQADGRGSGAVSKATWLAGLRDVLESALPWEEYVADIASVGSDGAVDYRSFLARYRVTHEDDSWQGRMLVQLHETLTKSDLKQTLGFFDINEDGTVTRDELLQVLGRFAIGTPDKAIKELASQMLSGKQELATAELLGHFHVFYRDAVAASKDSTEVRVPPQWARQLLDTVSRQCAMRQRDSVQLFRTFDTDGDGFISHAEFQAAMLKLGGYKTAEMNAEQQNRIELMLLDLAQWVDADGNGQINYLEFIEAFRLVNAVAGADEAAADAKPEGEAKKPPVANPLSMLLEQLCATFFQHRWSLKRAFEYFDSNGDGVLSPQEFTTAVRALASMATEEGDAPSLDLSTEQIERLAAALDKDGDGFIDYDEFLEALETSDSLEL